MRRLSVLGILAVGLVVAGCSTESKDQRNAWDSIVAQNYAQARAQYETILASNPNDPYANLNLGVAYEELGDNAMAAKYYKAAVANGADAGIQEVAQDGKTAGRKTTVKTIAQENLSRLGG